MSVSYRISHKLYQISTTPWVKDYFSRNTSQKIVLPSHRKISGLGVCRRVQAAAAGHTTNRSSPPPPRHHRYCCSTLWGCIGARGKHSVGSSPVPSVLQMAIDFEKWQNPERANGKGWRSGARKGSGEAPATETAQPHHKNHNNTPRGYMCLEGHFFCTFVGLGGIPRYPVIGGSGLAQCSPQEGSGQILPL